MEFGRDANQVSHALRHTTKAGLDSAAVADAISPGATALGSQLAVGEGGAVTALVNGISSTTNYFDGKTERSTSDVYRSGNDTKHLVGDDQ